MMLISILAFITAGWVLGILLWLVFLKKLLFDPRVYVLYGMMHWLLIAQLGTLLGYQFYEVKPYFDEATHAKAAIIILSAIVSFLMGYALVLQDMRSKRKQMKNRKSHSYEINTKKLAFITLFMGIVGLSVLYFFQKHPFLIKQFLFLSFLLTYLSISATVCASYILIIRRRDLRGMAGMGLKFILWMIVLVTIIMSNIAFVYPLFALIYWWFNSKKVQIKEIITFPKRITWRSILILVTLIWCVGVISVISKIGIQRSIAQGELVSLEATKKELVHRLITLDLFNVESYGIVLHVIEMYADSGNYLLGKSLLVIIPFLRFVWSDIRGFGRIMFLDVYGPSYETVNVSWAIPPIGELIANFSYPAVIFFYFFLGLACRYLHYQYQRSNNEVYLAFYSTVLLWLFLQQRGDFLNGNIYPAYVTFTVSIAFWLCRKKR